MRLDLNFKIAGDTSCLSYLQTLIDAKWFCYLLYELLLRIKPKCNDEIYKDNEHH